MHWRSVQWFHLPVAEKCPKQDFFINLYLISVPGYSGGTATDSHRVPLLKPELLFAIGSMRFGRESQGCNPKFPQALLFFKARGNFECFFTSHFR
jgi:hypothetical protein